MTTNRDTLADFDPVRDMLERVLLTARKHRLPRGIIRPLLETCAIIIHPEMPTDEQLQVRGLVFNMLLTEIIGDLSWFDKMLKLQRQRTITALNRRNPHDWKKFRAAAREAVHDPWEVVDYEAAAAMLVIIRIAWQIRAKT